MFDIRKSVICLSIVLSAAASAKDFALQVATPTEPNAPVVLHGTLTGDTNSRANHEFTCSAHLSLTNVSSKQILLIATESKAMIKANGVVIATLDQRDVNDYFLQSELLAPQKTVLLESHLFSQRHTAETLESVESPSAKVFADARVVFVQFADGSTWGDKKLGETYLSAREQAWKALQTLYEAYQSQDEHKFVTVLRGPNAQGYLGSLYRIYEHTNDMEAVTQEMKTLLQLGTSRMRFAQAEGS